jgi:hypothetical protein
MIRRLALVLSLAAMLSLGVVAVALAGGGGGGKGKGNSAAAHLCQHGGWKGLHRTDGSAFKNGGACVSYAAKGGTLSAFDLSQGTCPSGEPVGSVCVFLFGVGLEPGSGLIGFATATPGNTLLAFGPVAGSPVPANGIVDGLFLVAAPCSTFASVSAQGTAVGGASVSDSMTSADVTCS